MADGPVPPLESNTRGLTETTFLHYDSRLVIPFSVSFVKIEGGVHIIGCFSKWIENSDIKKRRQNREASRSPLDLISSLAPAAVVVVL